MTLHLVWISRHDVNMLLSILLGCLVHKGCVAVQQGSISGYGSRFPALHAATEKVALGCLTTGSKAVCQGHSDA